MFKPYLISYDLNSPGQKYDQIFEVIKKYTYIKLQKSFWLVNTSSTPNQIAKEFDHIIDNNDRLFICELKDSYQGIASDEQWTFIKEHIFK